MNTRNANAAFLCLSLALCFILAPGVMSYLCAAGLALRALRWAFFGR